MRSTDQKRTILISAGVVLLGAIAVVAWPRGSSEHVVALPSAAPRAGALPVIFDAPAFDLADQNGQQVTAQSLRGKVYVVDFIFTNCGAVCPRMTSRRTELQQRIADPKVTFVSFSVDPERDNAETRKRYAQASKVDESRWHFVAPADRSAAMKLAHAMKIIGPAREHDNPVLHADRFILVDASGKARGTYHVDDPAAMDRLVRDATTLAGDAR